MDVSEKITFRNVGIIGLGFTGLSIAIALKKAQMVQSLSAYDQEMERLRKAKFFGHIDDFTSDIRVICDRKDIVILSTPITKSLDMLGEIARYSNPGTTIFDTGSTKNEIVTKAENFFPKNRYFVGTHPLKNPPKELPAVPGEEVFKNQICFITSGNNTSHKAVADVTAIWQVIGAVPVTIRPDRHDYLMGIIKHLPYITSAALNNTINSLLGDDYEFIKKALDNDFMKMISPAATVIEPWMNIIDTNTENIVKTLDDMKKEIEYIIQSLENNHPDQVKIKLKNARDFSTKIKE